MSDVKARLITAVDGKAPQHKVEGQQVFEATEGLNGQLNTRDKDVLAKLSEVEAKIQATNDRLNGVLDTQLTGSSAYESFEVIVNQNERSFEFSSKTKEITVINNDADDIKVAFLGQSAKGTIYDNLDSTWTITGTWATNSGYKQYGSNSEYSEVVGDTAILSPTNVNVTGITWATVTGTSVGIAKLELSSDGGSTWQNPSDIEGVTRSDGAVGTAMNTYDGYTPFIDYDEISFGLPYPSQWELKVTVTGNKNANSTYPRVWIDAGIITDFQVVKVKAGDSLNIPIATDNISLVCDSNTPVVRVVALL